MSVPAFSPVIEDPQLTKAVSDLEQVRGGWAEELTKLDKYMRGQQFWTNTFHQEMCSEL